MLSPQEYPTLVKYVQDFNEDINVIAFVLISVLSPGARKLQCSIYDGDEREKQSKEWLMMNIDSFESENDESYLSVGKSFSVPLFFFGWWLWSNYRPSRYSKLKTKSDVKVIFWNCFPGRIHNFKEQCIQ